MILGVQSLYYACGGNLVGCNLAATFTLLGKRVLLIECDRRNLSGTWFGLDLELSMGWSDKYYSDGNWREALYLGNDGTYFLPYGFQVMDVETQLNVVNEMARSAKQKFDVIVINLSPSLMNKRELQADLMLRVVMPNSSVFAQLNAAPVALQENERIVMNGKQPEHRLTNDFSMLLDELFGGSMLSAKVSFDMALQEAYSYQTNIAVSAPLSISHIEFKQLASVVTAQCERLTLQAVCA